MSARDPIAEVIESNRRFIGRYSVLLEQKIARLGRDAFSFFRGTVHLFAEDQQRGFFDLRVPSPWSEAQSQLVGDVHSENFGTYKARDGSVRYDIDDFDEACRGNFAVDVQRGATSLFLLGGPLGWTLTQGVAMVESFVRAYADSITKLARQADFEAFSFTDQNPPQLLAARKLIADAVDAKRPDFINRLTTVGAQGRTITRGERWFDLTNDDQQRTARLLTDYVTRLDPKLREADAFYELNDCCGRVSGCGSLGRYRFVALVNGDGSKAAKNVLLEFKESLPSTWDRVRGIAPRADMSRAAEVVAVEQAMQTVSNRYLGWALDGNDSFQVREVGPRNERLEVATLHASKDFETLGRLFGKLLAKCHVKGDFRHPTQTPGNEILAALDGQADAFVRRTTTLAQAYAERVLEDYQEFVIRHDEVAKALGVALPTNGNAK